MYFVPPNLKIWLRACIELYVRLIWSHWFRATIVIRQHYCCTSSFIATIVHIRTPRAKDTCARFNSAWFLCCTFVSVVE